MNKEQLIEAEIERAVKVISSGRALHSIRHGEAVFALTKSDSELAKQILLEHGLAIIDRMEKEAPVVVVRVGWEERLYYPVIPLEEE